MGRSLLLAHELWLVECAGTRLQGNRPIVAAFVRRQNIWRSSRRKLAECELRLGVDVKRLACGAASADVRWFTV